MNNFLKIPSIVQIIFAEMLCLWFLTPFVGGLVNKIRPGIFSTELNWDGSWFEWILYLTGSALFFWLLREIFRPRIKKDSWFNLKTGRGSGGDYPFCSTHPSYIFVDAIMVLFAAAFIQLMKTEGERPDKFYLMLLIAAVFPVCRLLAWYVMGMKLRVDEAGETVRKAWIPVAWFCVPVYFVFGLIVFLYLNDEYQSRKETANAPIVDEQTFADSREAFTMLIDNSLKSEKATRYVRLRARQVSDAPVWCKSDQNRNLVSVLASLGPGGDVLIVGTDELTDDFKELIKNARGNRGQIIAAVGRLREMPPRSEIKPWKPYCGIDTLPPAANGGRWVLEIGKP